jgi:hypothetical protein
VDQRQDLFCTRCDVPVCAKCAFKAHRDCKDVISLDNAAMQARLELEKVEPKMDIALAALKGKVRTTVARVTVVVTVVGG